MKNKSFLFLCIILLLAVLSSCSIDINVSAPADTEHSVSTNASTDGSDTAKPQEQEADNRSAKVNYDAVIEEYRDAALRLKTENKQAFLQNVTDEYTYVNKEILSVASYYYNFGGTVFIEAYGEEYGKQEFGFYYSVHDINCDGVDELILGGGATPDQIIGRGAESYGSFIIFDVFTYCDETICPLIVDPDAETPILIYKDGIIDYSMNNYTEVYHMKLSEKSDRLVLAAKYYSENEKYYTVDSKGTIEEITEDEFMSAYMSRKERLDLQWVKIDIGD